MQMREFDQPSRFTRCGGSAKSCSCQGTRMLTAGQKKMQDTLNGLRAPDIEDCQDAHEPAYAISLAELCIEELKGFCSIMASCVRICARSSGESSPRRAVGRLRSCSP